jgi:redox-sensitive bicupin YhaK (pirin superfamily)
MIQVRKSIDRGAVNMGWLNAKHSFSFGHYYDPEHMGFGSLRVINEDRVQPGKGFAPHSHENMEIITYIIDGALEHKDNMGNGSVIRPGDVQRMTAGTGVQHSEFNHSPEDLVHLLQIWILPEADGLTPGYEEKRFPDADKTNRLRLVGSHDARDGSVKIHQDVDLFASVLREGSTLSHVFGPGRSGWLQIVRGKLKAGEVTLDAGDGAAISRPDALEMTAVEDAEFLLFDMG